MRELAVLAGQFAGALMDPISWVLIGLCAWVAIDRSGRWWHAALLAAAVIAVTLVQVSGHRSAAGIGGSSWVYTVIWPRVVFAALAFFIVRAFRDKSWNVLR